MLRNIEDIFKNIMFKMVIKVVIITKEENA